MDFQKLLDIAAQNKKKAEKEVIVNKRYTTSLPPPKKEKRSGVDRAAIQARLEKKQHDQKQKVLEEESKKKELLKLRAETKNKTKKSKEKPQENRRNVTPKENYEDSKHEGKHRSFMKKVQKVSERTRDEEEIKVVSKKVPDLPKKPKKPVGASKGPMSYEQLLALAANQQNKGKASEGKSKAITGSAKSKQIMKKSKPKMSEMDLKKAAAARKLGEMRRQEFLAQRRGGDEGRPTGKSNGSMTNGAAKPYKINGKTVKSELKRVTSGFKKPDTATSRPETSTAKTKHSSVPNGGMKHKSAGGSSKSVPNNQERRGQQTAERRKPPMTLTQSTVDQYFDEAPSSGHRPRPVSDRRPEPKRQGKMEKYFDRVPSTSRPRPGPDRRAPSVGQQMSRKRPVSAAPSFQAKRGRLLSDEDSDYEEDGFIDDTPMEEDEGEDVSHYIKEIFGYDKSKYGYESDYALKNMDSSYREIQKEEARSSRIGMMEDLEDIRREKEENKRLAQKKKKR